MLDPDFWKPHEESKLQWPLSDPHYCLALGVFRIFNEQSFASLPEDEDEDGADWGHLRSNCLWEKCLWE